MNEEELLRTGERGSGLCRVPQAQEPRRPRAGKVRGPWADLGVELTEEDIAEARRTTWAISPRKRWVSVLLDTHAALWHLLDSGQSPADARQLIDATVDRSVCIASISLVEIVYLVEEGRLPETALERLNAALSDPALGILLVALDAAVAQGMRQVRAGCEPCLGKASKPRFRRDGGKGKPDLATVNGDGGPKRKVVSLSNRIAARAFDRDPKAALASFTGLQSTDSVKKTLCAVKVLLFGIARARQRSWTTKAVLSRRGGRRRDNAEKGEVRFFELTSGCFAL